MRFLRDVQYQQCVWYYLPGTDVACGTTLPTARMAIRMLSSDSTCGTTYRVLTVCVVQQALQSRTAQNDTTTTSPDQTVLFKALAANADPTLLRALVPAVPSPGTGGVQAATQGGDVSGLLVDRSMMAGQFPVRVRVS